MRLIFVGESKEEKGFQTYFLRRMSEQEKPPTYGEAMQQENKGAWPSDPGRPLAPSAGWSQSFPPPPPNYGATNVVVSEPVVFPATQVIIVGGCPACRVSYWSNSVVV